MARSMPWFRVYTDFLFDSKIIELDFQDQKHFICLLALKSKGILDQSFSSLEKLDSLVASLLRVEQKIIGGIKKRLISVGLIDENWQPLAWAKRQRRSDQDPTNAERQRRYRERQKALKQKKEEESQIKFDFALDEIEEIAPEQKQEAKKIQNQGDVPSSVIKEEHSLGQEKEVKSTQKERVPSATCSKKEEKEICKRVIDYLNSMTGSQFRYANSHFKLIKARLSDGVTEKQIKDVISCKSIEWGNDPNMAKYLRPQTLFRQSNFENYLGQSLKSRSFFTARTPDFGLRKKFNPREHINRDRIRSEGDHGYIVEAKPVYRDKFMATAL